MIPDSLVRAVKHYLVGCERTDSGCLARPGLDHYGEIGFDGRRMAAHRAVLAVAVGEMPARDVVTRHSCDNPPCVAVEHLTFGTPAQNVNDTYKRNRRVGGWQKGEERPSAVLTEEAVRDLRRQALAGRSLSVIAQSAGVSYSSARMAVRGETWQHITDVLPVPGRRNKVGNARAYRLTRTEEAARVLELVDRGLSLAETAESLGVTRHTAWKLLQVAREVAA